MYIDYTFVTKKSNTERHLTMYHRLILIAEEETVYQHFPTPLINRLEKHRIVMESILKPWQLNLLREFHLWITKFTAVSGSHGTK